MTGMGRPKHYVPMGKWFWIVLLGAALVGFVSVDFLPRSDSFASRFAPALSMPPSAELHPSTNTGGEPPTENGFSLAL